MDLARMERDNKREYRAIAKQDPTGAIPSIPTKGLIGHKAGQGLVGGRRSKVNWKFIDFMKKAVPPLGKIVESAAYLGNDFREMSGQEKLRYMQQHKIGPYAPDYKAPYVGQNVSEKQKKFLIEKGYTKESDYIKDPVKRKAYMDQAHAWLKAHPGGPWEYDIPPEGIWKWRPGDAPMPKKAEWGGPPKGESYTPSIPSLPKASNPVSLAVGMTEQGLNMAHIAKKMFGHGAYPQPSFNMGSY